MEQQSKVGQMHIMRFGGFGGPGPGSNLGFVFLLLLFFLFMAVLWLAVTSTHRRDMHGPARWSNGPHHEHHGGGDSEARKILDRRFASGEIDEDEYQRRRKLLDGES